MASRTRIDSLVATGKGDDGTTGLLFGGDRIQKDDLRAEAFGTLDEAVACLGLARAELAATARVRIADPDRAADPAELVGSAARASLGALILRFQRELFVAAAELATNPQAWDRLIEGQTKVSLEMVAAVEAVLLEMERQITMPREFVVPGETRASAALEQARTVLRRAERRIVTLGRDRMIPGDHLLPYVNRLADLLWVMARAAEQAEAHTATPSRTGGHSRPVQSTIPPSPNTPKAATRDDGGIGRRRRSHTP